MQLDVDFGPEGSVRDWKVYIFDHGERGARTARDVLIVRCAAFFADLH